MGYSASTQIPSGPEGRPLNISPEGLGWHPRHDPARPGLPWERHRRGTHLILNQSAAWKNRFLNLHLASANLLSVP
jgi:hypothetical protein